MLSSYTRRQKDSTARLTQPPGPRGARGKRVAGSVHIFARFRAVLLGFRRYFTPISALFWAARGPRRLTNSFPMVYVYTYTVERYIYGHEH
jgi:hypothetical protein